MKKSSVSNFGTIKKSEQARKAFFKEFGLLDLENITSVDLKKQVSIICLKHFPNADAVLLNAFYDAAFYIKHYISSLTTLSLVIHDYFKA